MFSFFYVETQIESIQKVYQHILGKGPQSVIFAPRIRLSRIVTQYPSTSLIPGKLVSKSRHLERLLYKIFYRVYLFAHRQHMQLI